MCKRYVDNIDMLIYTYEIECILVVEISVVKFTVFMIELHVISLSF